MKTSHIIIAFILGMGLLASMTSCQSTVKHSDSKCNYQDSTLFLVFESKPLDWPEDNDPVFMTVEQSIGKYKGDTLQVEEDGTYPERSEMIRDNESGQPAGLHRVILGDYLYMKWYHK